MTTEHSRQLRQRTAKAWRKKNLQSGTKKFLVVKGIEEYVEKIKNNLREIDATSYRLSIFKALNFWEKHH